MEQVKAGTGSVWTWTAIDADSKLIISYTLGDRGAEMAKVFMEDVASRIANRIQLTTDGHRVYAEAVEDAFGADIDYAMLVKIYGASNDNPESRCSPATCIGCRTGVLSGKPDPKHISTSFVERSKPRSFKNFRTVCFATPVIRQVALTDVHFVRSGVPS